MADRSIKVVLEAAVDKFTAGMAKASGAVEAFDKKVGQNRDRMAEMGTAFTRIGLVASLGLGLVIKTSADFADAMSKVAATGADARENIIALKEAALEAGASTAFSATQAADGIEQLLKAGLSAEDVLGGALAGALDLAAAGAMSVGDAAEATATTMGQFSLKGRDAVRVADLLAAGAGKAMGDVSDMALALKQGGLVAAQFGLSVDETVGALAAFAQAGLVGSDAGTSLKTMLLRLANPADGAAKEMARLGVAAYDSAGNFVGLEALAGQLRDSLEDLSPAQRDAALATIFGSDAIRAANVLYKEGKSGIAGWTSAVSEQGYAAEVARTRLDNLRGDLEALSGAFETLGIRMGDGAQGPLRGMVQMLTNIVAAFADMPPAAHGAVLGLMAATAAMGLLGGGTLKTIVAIHDMRKAMAGLGLAGRTLALSTGAVGLALGAGLFALAKWAQGQAEARARTEDLSSTLDEQTGALTENTRAMTARHLVERGAVADAELLGISLKTVTEAAMGNADAMAEFNKAMDSTGLRTLTESSNEAAKAWTRLKGAVQGQAAELSDAQEKQRQHAEATEAAASATDRQAEASQQAADKARKQAEEVDNLIKSLFAQANAMLALSGTQIGFEAAIDDSLAAVKRLTGGLNKSRTAMNLDTVAGREKQEQINRLVSASQAYLSKLIEQGKSTDVVSAATKRARDALIATAKAAGLTEEAARDLADSYNLVPDTVATAVSAPGAEKAEAAVRRVGNEVNRVDGMSAHVRVHAEAGDVMGALARMQRMVNANPLHVPARTSAQIARAGGGEVTGPGTGTSDSIPAWLSNGEHVWTAREVEAYGGQQAMYRLRAAVRAGVVPRFATGGEVSTAHPLPRYATGGPVVAAPQPSTPQVALTAYVENPWTGEYHLARMRAVVADDQRDQQRGARMAGVV